MVTVLRSLARLALGGLAAAIVLLAVALSLVRLGVHYLPEYRAQVEVRLSEAVGQPIRIEALETAWAWRDLRVVLEGVRLGDDEDGLRLPRLEVNLDLYASVRDREPRLRELVLVEPSLTVQRGSDGAWSVVGFGEPRFAGLEELDLLMAQPGRLRVEDGRMDVLDLVHDQRYHFQGLHAAVDDDDGWRRLAGSGQLPTEWGGRAEFAARWPRDAEQPVSEGPLSLYASAEDARGRIMERLLGAPDAPPYLSLAGSLDVWADFPEGLPQPDGRQRDGDMAVRARDGSGTLPYLFREEIPFVALEAVGEWRFGPDGWVVNVNRTRVNNEDGEVHARVRVDKKPDQSPFLDIRASVDGRSGNAVNTSRYLPVGIMFPELVEWLDESIIAGTARRADVVFHGRTDDFPFDDGTGEFDVRADVTGVTLAYQPEWAPLTGMDGRLRFHGRSMRIEADRAEISGARVQQATAGIEDLQSSPLRITGSVQGPGDAYLDFLRTMPLAREVLEAPLEPLSLDGEHDLQLALTIPFDGAPVDVDGRVQLREGRLQLRQPVLALEALQGTVDFDRHGITAEDVSARFLDGPVTLAVNTGSDRDNGEPRIRLRADAPELDAAALQEALRGGGSVLDGRAGLQVLADFPVFDAEPDTADMAVNIGAHSDLVGVGIAMPAPMGKASTQQRALAARLRIGESGPEPLRVTYGDRLDALFDLHPDTGLRGAGLRLGGEQAVLPGSGSIRLDGHAERLDLVAWQRWFREHAPEIADDTGAATVDGFDLAVDRLLLGDLEFSGQRARGTRDVTGWSVDLDGPDIAGHLFWPAGSHMAVEADLEHLRLSLPAAVVDEDADLELDEDLLADVDPAALPGLRVRIQELELDDRPLGNLQVLGESVGGGYAVENILLRGDHHSVTGRAAWMRHPDERTEVELDVRSDDMGGLFAGLGYRNVIRGGHGNGRVAVTARSAPFPMALETLEGEVQLALRDGSLTQVEPGAGRVFGLLSVANLPRRLTLNFADVYEEGFAFDRIDADFSIADGVAETRTFTLVGPSARVDAAGTIDLAGRSYDQRITVMPRASSALPILGGVFGGPPGAAAMFLAQQMFSTQLDRVARMHYHLTGSWADPEFEPVLQEDGDVLDSPGMR